MKKRGRQPSFPKVENEQQVLDFIELIKSTNMDDLSTNEQKFFKSFITRGGYATEEEMNYDVFGDINNNQGVRPAMTKLYNLGFPIYPAQYGEIKRSKRGFYYKQCYSLVLDPVRVKALEKIREDVNNDKMNYDLELASQLDKFPERVLEDKESITLSKRSFLENDSIYFELNKSDWSRKDKLRLWNKYKEEFK